MKTFKKFQIAIIMLVLSFVAGCSDQLVSPVESVSTENQSSELKSAGIETNNNVFSAKIHIKGNQSYSFDFTNTGYYAFNSFSVLNCESKKRFEAIGYMDDELIILNCNNNPFFARSISVQNLTSEPLELDVIMSGSKVKPKDPRFKKLASE